MRIRWQAMAKIYRRRAAACLFRPSKNHLLHREHCRSFFLSAPQLQTVSINKNVGFTPAQLFAVVADVKRYSEFVPFCTESRVLHWNSDESFEAKLALGFLHFHEEYVSRVLLSPSRSVIAEAVDTALFSQLHTEWRFSKGAREGTCDLDFILRMQLRSHVHDAALRPVLDMMASKQYAAFCMRCESIYHDKAAKGAAEGTATLEQADSCEAVGAVGSLPAGKAGALQGSDGRSRGVTSVGVGKQRQMSAQAVQASTLTATEGAAAITAAAAAAAQILTAPPAARVASRGSFVMFPPSTVAVGEHEQRVKGQRAPRMTVRMQPAWRHQVESAFDAHQSEGALSLPGFIDACRSLSVEGGVLQGILNALGGDCAAQGSTALTKGGRPPSETPAALRASDSERSAVNHLGQVVSTVAMPHTESGSELRQLLLAACFVEFDSDQSGTVDRVEFRENLWMLTRASEEERMRFAFHKLDLNHSGALERDDLLCVMHRQLHLAQLLVPFLVQRRLRLEVTHGARARVGLRPEAPEIQQLSAKANGIAKQVLQGMNEQIEQLVSDLFLRVDVEGSGVITQRDWHAAWEQSPEISLMTGVEGLLSMLQLAPPALAKHLPRASRLDGPHMHRLW